MRKGQILALAIVALAVLLPTTAVGSSGASGAGEYVVLYAEGASLASARQAVEAAGGTVVKENRDVGVATVTSTDGSFLTNVAAQPALEGAARNVPLGKVAPLQRASRDEVEKLTAAERAAAKGGGAQAAPAPSPEPLAGLQWDMAMIHATADGSYKVQQGSKSVLVGILDTGIDGTHPDIAPNFDAALSRNFTTDIPDIDGPCEHAGCVDPANEDDDGHGTHVAGTVGAALNGLGIAGVAPNVTLVNIRAGQDSGFFFLQPTLDALTYAANNGIDVVNMSYFVDPWLFNCRRNPADTPEQQMEQRTIVDAVSRALRYAHTHGVTLIASEGNENTNLNNPTTDDTSPDYPPGTEYLRNVDNSCLVIPTEGPHVISVGAVGPSGIKADYSNWGTEQTAVTAPGGYFRDFAGTPQNRQVTNLILSAYPESLAILNGDLNPDGTPNNPFVVRDCQGATCAYYQYLQGTSMASPHAVGVAALIVSEGGARDRSSATGGLTMNPDRVETVLERTATNVPCPDPRLIDYTIPGRDRTPDYNALCTGNAKFNSIWGDGIVDALAAVRGTH
ncbi:MAG TPA: S8 family serine peptidase [Gaiellaceae bacterium]|nr:S8 family serine peptidase [Gaiellaceae bacterium]